MARLSYKKRKKLSKKSFVFPSRKNKRNPAGRGAYPIPDKAHARNALARVAAFGTPAEQAAVRAKVHAKFPGIGKGKNKEISEMRRRQRRQGL